MQRLDETSSVTSIPLERSNSQTGSTSDLRTKAMDLGGGRMSLLVSVFGVLLVIINIIITAILLGRPSTPSVNVMPATTQSQGQGPNQSDSQAQTNRQPQGISAPGVQVNIGGSGTAGGAPWCPNPNRTFLIQYGHDFGMYEYIDDAGFHKGFYKDLTAAVCNAAGVKCLAVFDKYSHCFTSDPAEHPILGTGLQARYYDVCSGYYPTVERIHFSRFTMPYLTPAVSTFYWKKGKPFDLEHFEDKVFVFMEGWVSNEKCVARLYKGKSGVPIKASQVLYVTDPETLKMQVLTNDSITAGFADPISMRQFQDELDSPKEEDHVLCVMGGAGQVGRLDNDFIDVWNRGFLKILYNGVYTKVCTDAARLHGHRGGKIDCLEGYNWEM